MRWRKTVAKWIAVPVAATLLFPAIGSVGTPTAAAYTADDADAAMEAFNDAFWDPQANMFWKDTRRQTHQDFWVEAELWELVMDAYVRTSDPELKAELRAQIDDIFDGATAKYGDDWTNNPFNDDIMWWAMGSARAYELTGDPKYLEKARYYFDFVYGTQWDDEFAGGGIWWLNTEHDTKNACINFPAAQTAILLYELTGEEPYLDAAVRIYKWGKTMLTDGNGKVFDRIEVARGPVPDSTHYNQGTFIGAAVGLYRITGDEVYLDDAVKAAKFTKDRLVEPNGLLHFEAHGDLKGGKTILMRNMGRLQQTLNEGSGGDRHAAFAEELNEWLAFNAEMAWSHRNADNLVDGNWVGQLLSGTYESWSASSAVEALTVIQPQDVELAYAAKDAYGKIEAEKYNVGAGFVMEGAIEGTLQLAGIRPGHYAAYKNVDFGDEGAAGFIARAASGTGGGYIEIRLDALNGPKVGTLDVEGTGGWNNYIDAVALLKDEAGNPVTVTGVHDVYLVFAKKNDDYLFNLNWFKFTTTDPTDTDAYAKLKAGRFDGGEGVSVNPDWGFLEGVQNDAYVYYEDIDFGSGAAGATFHLASGHRGGTIEVRLDALDGPIAGVVDIPALGDWNRWTDVMTTIDETMAVGVRDVYLAFRGTDGSDYPLNLDWFTFNQVKGKSMDAYGKLEAENYTSGVGFGRESGGGQTYLAGIYGPNQPYAMYNYIDFGDESPSKFYVQAASATSGGTLEVRLGGLNGPVVASARITGTGGWQNFQVFSADVAVPVTGKHIVFMRFVGNDWLYNFDKFTFGDPAVFTKPTPPPEPVDDGVPPGEVENVRVTRVDGELTLTWDGPYDLDATTTHIALLKDGEAIGDVVEVRRGVQRAALSGDEAEEVDAIRIWNTDAFDRESDGVVVEAEELPDYALTVDGGAELEEYQAIEDYLTVAFGVPDGRAGVRSATIAIDGATYAFDPESGASVDIDVAGSLGDKTAYIAIEDENGHRLYDTFEFTVTTSVYSMQQLIVRYESSGDASGPLVPQLTESLDQVAHHLDKGDTSKAADAMEKFVKLLNQEALAEHIAEAAKTALNADAEALIEQWRGAETRSEAGSKTKSETETD